MAKGGHLSALIRTNEDILAFVCPYKERRTKEDTVPGLKGIKTSRTGGGKSSQEHFVNSFYWEEGGIRGRTFKNSTGNGNGKEQKYCC